MTNREKEARRRQAVGEPLASNGQAIEKGQGRVKGR